MLKLLVNLCCGTAAVAVLAGSPGGDGSYAVLAPDGVNAAGLVAEADGTLKSVSTSGRVAVAQSNQPGFRRRLLAAGAVLVFNPVFAAGCRPTHQVLR